jgi:hypothetical protein
MSIDELNEILSIRLTEKLVRYYELLSLLYLMSTESPRTNHPSRQDTRQVWHMWCSDIIES